MKKLLDTTFLIHYLTDGDRVEPFLEANDGPATEFLTTTITVKELAVGLHRVEDDPSIAQLRSDLGWIDVVPFETAHAFHAGRIEAALDERGVPRDRLNSLGADVLIGGVALAEDAVVVTENVDDFDLMPDVEAESY